MAGIGILIRTAAKVGGRIIGRIAGPLGAIVTIGELGYLGLKYSGTLDNFKKLYCDKCRTEIPMPYIRDVSSPYDPGMPFDVFCPLCKKEHCLAKIPMACSNCRSLAKDQLKSQEITVPAKAKFLLLTCPQCNKSIRLTKNKYYS